MRDTRDIIISVRMPGSMVRELKSLVKEKHYLDLSEEIRSIIRKKCQEHGSPYDIHVQKVVDDIHDGIIEKEEIEKKKLIVHKLKKLLDEIEHEK